MSYSLHRGAERELTTAFRFYQVEASPGIARRFLDEFERVADLLVEYPDIGAPAGQDGRAFPLRGFPYSVLYRPTAAGHASEGSNYVADNDGDSDEARSLRPLRAAAWPCRPGLASGQAYRIASHRIASPSVLGPAKRC